MIGNSDWIMEHVVIMACIYEAANSHVTVILTK
jgi:hypothetical protein